MEFSKKGGEVGHSIKIIVFVRLKKVSIKMISLAWNIQKFNKNISYLWPPLHLPHTKTMSHWKLPPYFCDAKGQNNELFLINFQICGGGGKFEKINIFLNLP